ncbi:GRAM domain family protein [Rhynchospora pubera]|uniref:GRAM domain family protein n=1 Tax=Rhynchospora pubera TaxID=906938 RepID=A0AAV8HB85_9POAL|nr:GRAM domain family protein [Rhynchospora pubera]
MKKFSHGQVIGIPVGSSRTYAEEKLPQEPAYDDGVPVCTMKDKETFISGSKQSKDSVVGLMSRFSKKADNLAHGIHEHVSLGPKFSDTVKGKLTLGKRILQAGGIERVFRQSFMVETGEELLKASQCYLSTTAGPIAGILFISNKKIAFRSDRSLSLSSPKGEVAKVPYKILIPLEKVKEATEGENMNKPEQKYVQIVTVDDFEFWFMGFVNYQRSFRYLKQAISEL